MEINMGANEISYYPSDYDKSLLELDKEVLIFIINNQREEIQFLAKQNDRYKQKIESFGGVGKCF